LIALVVAWLGRRLFLESDWLSGWAPICIALLLITLLRSRRWFLALLALCAVFALFALPDFYASQVNGSEALAISYASISGSKT